jgi:hypothetical protein
MRDGVLVSDALFSKHASARLHNYAQSQLLGAAVADFSAALWTASQQETFVNEEAAALWLDMMVDHFLAGQSHGECVQHSMMVLTQTSLQAMLSVRHTVMENSIMHHYIGSLVPHVAKNILCPIKHPNVSTMLLATRDGDYDSTFALAKMLQFRLVYEFTDASSCPNHFLLQEGEHQHLFRVARAVHAELFPGAPANLAAVALEWRCSARRCASCNVWPSEFVTNWNAEHGATCFALAREDPLAVILFLADPDPEQACVAAYNPCQKRGAGSQRQAPEKGVVRLQRIRAAPVDTDAAGLCLLRVWLPRFLNARATGLPGIHAAWVARYVCPLSKPAGDRREFCVKTHGSNLRAVVGGAVCLRSGGLADRATVATDDLSATTGMGLFGVDTAVSYVCHDEVAAANSIHPEHLFVHAMVLSHAGTLTNVSGKGYVRLGADFCGQIAVEDLRTALYHATLGVPFRPGPLSKAAAIMFGKQTSDGTNVSRYVWSPQDDTCVTQASVAASDPVHYGPDLRELRSAVGHWDAQKRRHDPPPAKRTAEDDEGERPTKVLETLDRMTYV